MYTAINSKGGRENGGLIFCFYFVMLTLCGDYTLLNVFLAIACDSLDQAAALTEAEEAEKERQREAAEALLNIKEGKVPVEEEEEEEIDPIKAAELAFERAAEAAARAAAQEDQVSGGASKFRSIAKCPLHWLNRLILFSWTYMKLECLDVFA